MLRPLCSDTLVGLDFSEGMLAEARERLGLREDQGSASPRVELVKGDALELAYEEEFDLVTCFGAFGHIPRSEEPRPESRRPRACADGPRRAGSEHLRGR
jgi:SAM-dependent methyltransferase